MWTFILHGFECAFWCGVWHYVHHHRTKKPLLRFSDAPTPRNHETWAWSKMFRKGRMSL